MGMSDMERILSILARVMILEIVAAIIFQGMLHASYKQLLRIETFLYCTHLIRLYNEWKYF